MFKAFGSGNKSSSALMTEEDLFDPPLVPREDLFTVNDYLRPMAGGAVYAIICGFLFTFPVLFSAGFMGILIALAVDTILVVEIACCMALSAFIHHRVFLHRLRTYGPQFYSSELALDTPAAEAFELCLAATSELPKSKIVGMDEKAGTIRVSLKGNFWITVDRQVTLRVKASGAEKSTVSVDPSIKLTKFRRKLIRLIWGDKWYPLIFRSDVNWNRKIINSITEYIESVPNWDHRHDPQDMLERAFRENIEDNKPEDLARRPDAA